MRMIWLALFVVAFAGCGADPLDQAAQETPAPVIAEGIYRGLLTYTVSDYIGGDWIEQRTETKEVTEIFGPDSLPLTHTGEPLYVGYTTSGFLGIDVEHTITAIRMVTDGVRISYEASIQYETAEGTETLNVSGSDTYITIGAEALEYTWRQTSNYVFADGFMIMWQSEGTAVLRR